MNPSAPKPKFHNKLTVNPTRSNGVGLDTTTSRGLDRWLAEMQISLACTTYQSGRLFLIGAGVKGHLALFERAFDRAMGLWSDGQTIWLGSGFRFWRFENSIGEDERIDQYDRLYVPRLGYTTGQLDAHDVVQERSGRVLFANTLFSCLSTVSERHNFEPVWRPPFISSLAAEDRCHLNGIALDNGEAWYVTVCARTDAPQGWRKFRHDGGCVLDVVTGETVAANLSMPSSPRVHKGELWLLESGSGYLGRIDRRGHFERIVAVPGYARGLAFVDRYAIVGLSKPRHGTFTGLELDNTLMLHNEKPWCGLQIIDLERGEVVHWIRFEGIVSEIFGVAPLPGVTCPKAYGFLTDEIQLDVSFSEKGQLRRWTGQLADSPSES